MCRAVEEDIYLASRQKIITFLSKDTGSCHPLKFGRVASKFSVSSLERPLRRSDILLLNLFCVMRDSIQEDREAHALMHLCGDTHPLPSSSMLVQETP